MEYKYKIFNRRYTGSKEKLKDWIFQLIQEHCKGETFLDLFGGTGVIAAESTKHYSKIIINDLLYSNEIIYKAFFDKSEYSLEKIVSIKNTLNAISGENLKDNYFSKNFGGKYFTDETCKKIWEIRKILENLFINGDLTSKEYSILLASLLYSLDRIANTVGHYDAFFSKKMRTDKFIMELIEPLETDNVEIDIQRRDSNELAEEVKADIVYIDPPYNSRQYSRFYHVLETIVKFEEKPLFGVAMKPEPENMSEYCKKSAPAIFEDLIGKLKVKYIVVSYNNTYDSKSGSSKNKITLEEIKKILEKKGKTLEFEKSHKHFNTGKTDFKDHKEFVFITKVGKK